MRFLSPGADEKSAIALTDIYICKMTFIVSPK